MKKCAIHYFSGTGNTERAVNWISDRLRESEITSTITKVENGINPDIGDEDFHIFAFPVYGFSAPRTFIKYVKNIRNIDRKQTAILSINGAEFSKGKLIDGYSAYASEYIENILKKKNFDVFLLENISFPVNWTQVMNPPKDDEIKTILEKSKKEIEAFSDSFINMKTRITRSGFIGKYIFQIFIPIFANFAGRMLGKLYISDKNCNYCKVCSKNCPTQNIKFFGKTPVWGIKCVGCNRCINICPRRSIQTSILRVFLHSIGALILGLLSIFAILGYSAKILPIQNNILRITLNILTILGIFGILIFLQLTVYDYLIRILEKIPLIRNLFQLNFTKKFRRYFNGQSTWK